MFTTPSTLPPAFDSELSRIAERTPAILEAVPPLEAVSALLDFNTKLSRHRDKLRAEASAPPDAMPPEVLAKAKRTLDENEIAAAIQELRAGGGRKLKDFLPELETSAHKSDGSAHG